MTYEEAIEKLEDIKKFFVPKAKEACNLAIEALQKQVPMKPIRKYGRLLFFDYCPICNNELNGNEKYCDCGQRLDWSED